MRLNVMREPEAGERRTLSEQDLDKLIAQGCYDSYSRVYIIQGMAWRVIDEIHRANGTADYTLVCEGKQP